MIVMLQSYVQDEDAILDYTVDGEPLTRKNMQEVLNSSVNETKKGYGYNSEDVRKSKENW